MPTSIPEKTLVLVADGRRAVLFRTHGLGDALTLRREKELTPRDLEDEGPSGSRPPEQSERQTDEATFVKQVARTLNAMKLAGEYETVVICADPQSLGQMRPLLHDAVNASVVRALGKVLTNSPVEDIAEAIRSG